MAKEITYLTEIIKALEKLNGMGSLTEINEAIEEDDILPNIHTNRNWKDNVRAMIQRHCSQTQSFLTAGGRKENDLFYSVYGLGEGIWGLREYKKLSQNVENEEMTAFEKRKEDEILYDNNISSTEKESLIKARVGQGKFRKQLFEKYDKCVVTGIQNPKLLIASHIKPWRSSSNYERLSPNNGLLLSPLYDKLFDLGFITFNKNTQIILSNALSSHDKKLLCVDTERKYIPNCSGETVKNFEYHRDVVFKK